MADRSPGWSLRAKLTLSYFGFLMVAWAAVVLIVGVLLRYLPIEASVGDQGFVPGRNDLIRAIVPYGAWGTVGLAVVGVVGGWWLAGRMLRPIDAIAGGVAKVEAGSLSHRIALPGPDDELGRLADGIDAMLARLQKQFDEQRRFTANASHELRTPHAVMKTMLEVSRADREGRDVDEVLGRLSEINDRSIATLEALIRLARAEHAPLQIESVDLADLVRSSLDLVDTDGVVVDLGLEPAVVQADPALVGQAVDNLVINSFRHNRPGDAIVRIATHGRTLTVENTGPVLEPELVATLTEPFVRGAGRTRAEGSGLGLTLVESIVRTHRGTLTLKPRPGGGLVATLTLRDS